MDNPINYLVFEGAGGRGLAHLGAIAAIEDYFYYKAEKLLNETNITQNNTDSTEEDYNQSSILTAKSPEIIVRARSKALVNGIAGCSFSALFAFGMAMGMRSYDFLLEFEDKDQFKKFFDYPVIYRKIQESPFYSENIMRSVDYNNKGNFEYIKRGNYSDEQHLINFIKTHIPEIKPFLKNFFEAIDNRLIETPYRKKKKFNYGKRKKTYVPKYLEPLSDSLLTDYYAQFDNTGGFFPGKYIREMLQQWIQKYLFEINNQASSSISNLANNLSNGIVSFIDNHQNIIERIQDIKGENFITSHDLTNESDLLNYINNISFYDFYLLTDVDLKLVGTNVSREASRIFSKDYTPDFPVIEAVAISMNIPVLFSPIFVESAVISRSTFEEQIKDINTDIDYETYINEYKGLYSDGSILNSFPIHLFNSDNPFEEFLLPERRLSTKPLNPNVLGIQIEESQSHTLKYSTMGYTFLNQEIQLPIFLQNLMKSLSFYSKRGYLHKKISDQTIILKTLSIKYLDFYYKEKEQEEERQTLYYSACNQLNITPYFQRKVTKYSTQAFTKIRSFIDKSLKK